MKADNLPGWGWVIVIAFCISGYHYGNKIKSLETWNKSLQSEVDTQTSEINDLTNTLDAYNTRISGLEERQT